MVEEVMYEWKEQLACGLFRTAIATFRCPVSQIVGYDRKGKLVMFKAGADIHEVSRKIV